MKQQIMTRKATIDDAVVVHRLFCETVQALDRNCYTEMQIQQWASHYGGHRSWEQKITESNYVLATNSNDEVYGFCSLQVCGCIDKLYVHPGHQHTGIASCLLEAIYELADKSHIATLYSYASPAATPFFEKNGFLVRDVSLKTIGDAHYTCVLVDKRLWLM